MHAIDERMQQLEERSADCRPSRYGRDRKVIKEINELATREGSSASGILGAVAELGCVKGEALDAVLS